MLCKRLTNYLEDHDVAFSTITHPLSFTAEGIARVSHIPGRMMAKSVVLNADGKWVMAVMPANKKIDLNKVKEILSTKTTELANENNLKDIFPDCEIGAMPPFGNLYGMDVIVSADLTLDEEIAFNAGDHRELMEVNYKDYARLVHPQVMSFTY